MLTALTAILTQGKFFRGISLILLADIVLAFTNGANESQYLSLPLFSHM